MNAVETDTQKAQDEDKLKIFECEIIRKIVELKIENETEIRQWMKHEIEEWMEQEN